MVILSVLAALAVGVLVVFFLFLQGLKFSQRGRYLEALALEGVIAQGVVVEKARKLVGASMSPCLKYRFQSAGGKVYEHQMVVSSDVWRSYRKGGTIDVVYLSWHPGINEARYMVERIRQTLFWV